MSVDSSSGGREHRIILANDDYALRTAATTNLLRYGYDVFVETSGESAIEAVPRVHPDLVLLDAELDGFDVCARIRELGRARDLPIVMMTTLGDSAAVDRAYECGATDFVTKPIEWNVLHQRLRYLLRNSETIGALARSRKMLDDTQRIAALGTWEWLAGADRMSFTEEARRLAGLDSHATTTLDEFLDRLVERDREKVQDWMHRVFDGREPDSLPCTLPGMREIVLRAEPLRDEDDQVVGIHGTMQDVTEQRRAEQRIRRLAYIDQLTGLPNREALSNRLTEAIGSAPEGSCSLAAIYVDLDDFKRVNDMLGHAAGDVLLAEVSARLVEVLRSNDPSAWAQSDHDRVPVFRLGGDEFALLATDLGDAERLAEVVQRVVEAVRRPYRLSGCEVSVTPSVGAAMFPEDASTAASLLKCAESAMRYAKNVGKAGYRLYDAEMSRAERRRTDVESQLRQALDRNELELNYQPLVDVATRGIDGFEVLLRWKSGDLGAISPVEFIPVAEETRLIVPIGEWVLRTACTQARLWTDAGLKLPRVAVNISMLQFTQPDFPRRVRQILAETRLPPGKLELEITESMLAADIDGAIRTLSELKAVGVQLSIDDFGTGYSSLSHLKHFPVDRLKIDREFVNEVTSDPDSTAIVMAVIRMASSMELSVVAEGVETEAQLQFLQARHCDEVQGYFFSPPVSAERAGEILGNWTHRVGEVGEGSGRSVLIVDDDAAQLALYTNALADENYEILTTVSPSDAFDVLAGRNVGVIVADHSMPEMEGTELLSRVSRISPETTRILMSGHGERAVLVDAINRGQIYRFLPKPVSLKMLRSTIRAALIACEEQVAAQGTVVR